MTPLVQVGEVWRVGPHLFACGDLEMGAGAKFLSQFVSPFLGAVHLFYADPPWNTGIARSFRSRAGLPWASENAPVTVDRLLAQVVTLAAKSTAGDVYIEMGNQHAADLAAWMAAAGIAPTQDWSITYANGTKPSRLLCCRRVVAGASDPPVGLDSSTAPAWAIERSTNPGEVVFDCCTGLGLTAVKAIELGRSFVGLELGPTRLARTLMRVSRVSGLQPECAGILA